jgi:hypothetical protein
LVNENDEADYRQNTDTGDGDVEDVSGPSVVWLVPEQQNEKPQFADELTNSLNESVTITKGNDGALGKGIDDQRQENPPKVGSETVVEDTVLAHVRLVHEQLFLAVLRLLGGTRNGDNTPGKESQNSSECTKGQCGEDVSTPRITISELVEAVKSPGSVQNQDLRSISNYPTNIKIGLISRFERLS